MPRGKRDPQHAVMKPRKQSTKLNVSLIFSSSDADDLKSDQEFSDALSYCSQSTVNTDTLRSGASFLSDPPYSPSSSGFPETPTTPQNGTQSWETTPRASISSSIPYTNSVESESIYDTLAPKKPEVNRSTSEFSRISASTSSSSIFLVPNEVYKQTVEANKRGNEHVSIPVPSPALDWETSDNMKLKIKSKKHDQPEVMKPQRVELPPDQPESPFTKLQRASMKKRKNRKSEELTVMTPKREHLNSSPGVTPPASRNNSISKGDEILLAASPEKSRTNSESSKTSGEYKCKTGSLTRMKSMARADSIPTPPVRTTSKVKRLSSSSNSDNKNRTLERPKNRTSRPNSIMEPSNDTTPSSNGKTDTPNRQDGTLKRNGTLKKKKKAATATETPKKHKSESVEISKKEDPQPQANKKKTDTPVRQQLSFTGSQGSRESQGSRGSQEAISRMSIDSGQGQDLVMRPQRSVDSEKENNKNSVNDSKQKEELTEEEEEDDVAHFIKRCDSKVIYNDFEEMEALLLEQERLADNLEKERQEKVELEKAKVEQDKQQEQMKDTIKTLEEEIVKVDCQMVKLKVSNEDEYDDLEDKKRSLHARLIEERGKQRQMDDLISLSGMSVYSENGLMLNQDISDYSKRELLDQIKTLKKEKSELETSIKQLRCDSANEKRKQDKVIKDLMTQIRGFHNVPVQRQDSYGPQETMAMINDLRSRLEQMETQNKSQTKLIERLVHERNQHLNEKAKLKAELT